MSVLAAAACGDGGEREPGELFVSGSSTVEPISIRVAELLEDTGSDVVVDIEGPGTGDGFKKFCEGETDVSDASRPIKDEEVADCEAAGVEFVELEVAIDGISVLTSAANDVECLSFADIYALMGPESEAVRSWRDAEPLARELGSDTGFPAGELEISAPGPESGTFDSFVEIVLEDVYEERLEAGRAPEADPPVRRFPGQSDDNVILQGIEGSPTSFGWVGYAFARDASDAVAQIPIAPEPGERCVAPTAETIADGSYPVARTLYIYVNAARAQADPALASFVDFYLSDDGLAAVEEVGYVPLPDDRLAATRARWEARRTGTAT